MDADECMTAFERSTVNIINTLENKITHRTKVLKTRKRNVQYIKSVLSDEFIFFELAVLQQRILLYLKYISNNMHIFVNVYEDHSIPPCHILAVRENEEYSSN